MTLYELFVKLSADTKDFKGPMAAAQAQIGNFGASAGSLAAKLGTGIGLAAIGTAAVHAAEKFEQAGFTIRRATGATGVQLEVLEKSFGVLYKQSAKSAEEIAGALSTLAVETKASGKPLEELVKQNLAFAKVMGSDVKGSIEATQTVFKQFGIVVVDQADALNLLYKVHQATAISTAKLTSTMASAGPILQAFGFSFAEVAILVGNFEEKGRNVESITGAMARAMKTFAAAGQDPKKAFEELIRQMEKAPSVGAATKIALDKIGAKGGSAAILAEAVKASAFQVKALTEEVDKNIDSIEKAAKATVGIRAELIKWQHQIESVVAGHKDLVIAAPMAVLALGTIGGAVKGILPYLRSAAGGMAGLFGSAVIASIWATSSAIDVLNEKYESFGKKGKTFLEAWTAEQGKAASADLGVRVSLPKISTAPVALTEKELAKAAERDYEARIAMLKRYDAEFEEQLRLLQMGGKVRTELDEADLALFISEQKLNASLREGSIAIKQANVDWSQLVITLGQLPLATRKMATEVSLGFAISSFEKLSEAYKYFGLQTVVELEAIWAKSAQMYRAIADDADASMESITRAWIKMERNAMAVLIAHGQAVGEEWKKLVDQIEGQLDKEVLVTAQKVTKSAGEMSRQISTVMTDLSRSMKDLIFKGGKFKDVMAEIGKAMVRMAIEAQFKRIGDAISDVVSKSGVLGKVWGAIFGGGTSAAGGAVSAGAGAAGGAGSAAGGAAGAAGGMISIVGAIGSIGTMVSSIIGNFQFAGMNKSLDIIVQHTLRTANDLANLRADQWTRHSDMFRKLDDLWGAIRNIGSVGSAAPAGGQTFNFNNVTFGAGITPAAIQTMFTAAFRQAQLAGA